MGRKNLISENEFLQAYKQCSTLQELARTLKLNYRTVHNYLHRYGLKSIISPEFLVKKNLAKKVYKCYGGLTSISDLALRFNIPRKTTREYIQRGVDELYDGLNPPEWPKPWKLHQIKIVKYLIDFADVKDPILDGIYKEPLWISDQLNLSENAICEYIDYANHLKAIKNKPELEKLRAKKDKHELSPKKIATTKALAQLSDLMLEEQQRRTNSISQPIQIDKKYRLNQLQKELDNRMMQLKTANMSCKDQLKEIMKGRFGTPK
jgi:hypothetical protein